MTSEEIIQKLLSEDKITASEALVILKDLAKIGIQQILPVYPKEPEKRIPLDTTVVMYGVTPTYTSDTYTIDATITNSVYKSASTSNLNSDK